MISDAKGLTRVIPFNLSQARAARRKEFCGDLGQLEATAPLGQSVEGLRDTTVKSRVEVADSIFAGSAGVSASGPIRATDNIGGYSEVRRTMARVSSDGNTL